MRKLNAILLVLLVILLWFAKPIGAAEKPIELEFCYSFASSHGVSKSLEEMSRTLEQRTGGRVKITTYPDGSLVPVPRMYDGVVKGIVDIGHGAFTFSRGRFPLLEVLDLPLGLRNSVEGAKLANAFYKKFRPKELDDVKVLFLVMTPPTMFQTTKRIKTIEDLKGLKTRVPGGTVAEVISAFGAVPVAMPMAEAYDAMRKGIVEAVMSAYEPLEIRSLADVVKYTVENYETGMGTTGFVIMNKEKWNGLPPEIQRIFDETADEYAEKVAIAWDKQEQNAKKYAVEKGVEIIKLPKSEEAKSMELLQPVLDKYVREKTAKGLPAKEALKFCQDYVAKNFRGHENRAK
jgi:TRAP-type C4-dicarboxylate transport system substrate-binding protein